MEETMNTPETGKEYNATPALTHVEANQEGYRWVAITAMLFAIGIILHTVSPNVGGVTPNWTIAMYSIVINLTRPPLKRAIGIGFVAGLTLIPSSKSAAYPLYHRLCFHLCIRRRVHFYFKTGAGPAAEGMDFCHAAGSGGSRRAQRPDYIWLVPPCEETVLRAGRGRR